MSTPKQAWTGSDYKLAEQREAKELRDAVQWLGRALRRSVQRKPRKR